VIRRSVWLSATIFALLASVCPGYAAEISSKKVDGINIILIDGIITADDVLRFDSVSDAAGNLYDQQTVVILNSDGGNVVAGLSIGEAIRAKAYATAVVNDGQCASICAMIWMAGTKRYLSTSAKLGFHAAYVGTGDDAKESGLGNAFIGAYLSKLGLSYPAIAFATAAGPTEMQWLHPSDAQRIGIHLDVLPDPVQQPHQSAQAAPPADSPTDSPAERQAKGLVASYYADWSRSGTDVEGLAQYYGDAAVFYGTNEPRDKIMDEKRKFSARWPIRRYTVKPSTVFVQCSDTCAVTGVVEWDAASIERGAHSVGTANFVLKLALNNSGTGGIILSENGAVLAAHNDVAPSAQASLPAGSADPTASPAYTAGRQARLDYEAWYGGLLAGDYRDGASFWAENRSLKAPASCSQPARNYTWQTGCFADQGWLSPVDRRRRTEKDYKAGWNSL
jgi:hypothetical protein